MDRYCSIKMFITESLCNYNNPAKTGFAILHAIIAVELALKERLSVINPQLIYEDINSKRRNKNTLSLSKLPLRLKNSGVTLNENDRKLISDIAKWRNDLVHNIPTHNNNSAKRKIGKLFDFIFSFLSKELNKEITEIMSSAQISSMKRIISEANDLIEDAKQKAIKNSGQEYRYPCNECHEQFVVGECAGTIFCFLCNQPRQKQYCQSCEKSLYFYAGSDSEDSICKECVEDAGDEYISCLIDSARKINNFINVKAGGKACI